MGDWLSTSRYSGGTAFHSGNTVVLGDTSDVADYGKFTSGTSTDGWKEASTALNLSTNYNGAIIVLSGDYVFSEPLTIEVQNGGTVVIMGLGSGSATQGASNEYLKTLPTIRSNVTSATQPLLMIAPIQPTSNNNGGHAVISNITMYGNGQEQGGLFSLGCGLNLDNVFVNYVRGQAAIAQIGWVSTCRWTRVAGSLSTINVPSSNALVFGGPANINAAGLYVVGEDVISSLYGYTITGRPEIKMSECAGGASSQDYGACAYFSDCNWINVQIDTQSGYYGIVMYHPFADDYNWGQVIQSHIESITSYVFYLDGSAVGEGGSNMPTGVVYIGGNSSDGATPNIYATGCAFYPISPGSGAVGAAPSAITVGASPYTYTQSYGKTQMVIVSGGTVTEIEYNGTSTGLTSGAFPLNYGDSLTITYTTAPTMLAQVT